MASIPSILSRISQHHSHPSPASSESDGDSIDTRSTTPSSFAGKTIDGLTSHVYVDSNTLQAEMLEQIFDKHCEGGLLTMCVDRAYRAPGLDFSGFKYVRDAISVKSIDNGANAQFTMSTNIKQAAHLLAFSLASLRSVISTTSDCGQYTIYILERPTVVFRPLSHTLSFSPSLQNSTMGNIPTVAEWEALWRAWDLARGNHRKNPGHSLRGVVTSWDLVTLKMIPQEMLHQKPIDLRHKCLFYIGHIPTFLDMLLSKAIGGAATEPSYFWNIFERGIDPHVDDPDHCHNHSDVPKSDEDWPTLDTILGFRSGVRARLLRLYNDIAVGKQPLARNIARTLVMTLEHEGFHVETLLYMLIQRSGSGTLPPSGFVIPPWDLLKLQWDATPPPSTESVVLGPTTLTLGHNDSEADDFLPESYGWDNESPARQVEVGKFRASWRPVTNKEFLAFWRAGKAELPKSWVEEDAEIKVRSIYGLVPIDIAAEWPVLTAYDDLSAYAKSKGGRLPTEPELRLFLNTYDVGYEGGANIGFRNWHPVPATTGINSEGGRGSNGGIWEWTTTLFDTHEGLVPTNLFQGYSTDFFDTKHQTVLGASYATLPRLGRETLRNFWQCGYGYAWVGARVIWDLD
ncbi:DUF323 domain-containing protein [Mycena crocata]|nr:DUF323 domain-containing protein [Mycena crocata]